MSGVIPIVSLQAMRCLECEHEWRAPLISNVPIDTWTAHVKSMSCPTCAAAWNRLAFRREEAAEEETLP